MRTLSRIARSKHAERELRMKAAYLNLIEQARQVVKKADQTLFELDQLGARRRPANPQVMGKMDR